MGRQVPQDGLDELVVGWNGHIVLFVLQSRMANGLTFSRKPREQTVEDLDHSRARLGGCIVFLGDPLPIELKIRLDFVLDERLLHRVVPLVPGSDPLFESCKDA